MKKDDSWVYIILNSLHMVFKIYVGSVVCHYILINNLYAKGSELLLFILYCGYILRDPLKNIFWIDRNG